MPGHFAESRSVNRNFRDILLALSAEGVEFLIVGAYALAVHGLPRATGDLDIWVRLSEENARRLWQALLRFGAPLSDMDAKDFRSPDIVFRIGLPPSQIDILTSISGVDFDAAWSNRVEQEVEGVKAFVISRIDQIRNKRSTDRPKDKLDADWLERHSPPHHP
jgi:hypothetical protein